MRKNKELNLAIFLASIPLFFHLPLGITAWCIFFPVIQSLGKVKKVSNYTTTFIGALALVILMLTYGFTYSLDLCVALLAMATCVKPMEAKTSRDNAVSLCMSYFVSLAALWYSTTITVAIYSVFSLLTTTSILAYLNDAFDTLRDSFKFSSRIILQALPLAIVLFVVFPRLSNKMWSFNISTKATTGFSDSISMGGISSLASDPGTAFRAVFYSKVPKSLYWRGLVFNFFDGKNWKAKQNSKKFEGKRTGKNKISYDIILEPHHKKWIFSLGLPVSAPNDSKQTEDGIILAKKPITDKALYNIQSVSTNFGSLDKVSRRINTKIPNNVNPKASKLAQSWKEQGLSNKEIIKKIQSFFITQNLKYSLEAPRTSGDHVDDFLFRTKIGYCEHFATAFAFMLRAADVPARLVGGFLGGEVNKDYIIVRNSDAHVWTEIWDEKIGWFRYDPTPGGTYLSTGASRDRETSIASSSDFSQLRSSILLKLDSINFAWNKWVLGYDKVKQENLLKDLGLKGKSALFICSIVMFVFMLAIIIAYYFNQAGRKKALDSTGKTYEKFIKKFAKHGYKKPENMGPRDYQAELEKAFPKVEENIKLILDLYVALKYEKNAQLEDQEKFKSLVSNLKIPKKNGRERSLTEAQRSQS